MLEKRFFRLTLGTIMILTIVFLLSKVSFIFNPFITLFRIIIVPLTISGFLYYLLRPVVGFLTNRKLNKITSILLIYLLFAGVIILFLIVILPPLQYQVTEFINNLPKIIKELQIQLNLLRDSKMFSYFVGEGKDVNTDLTKKFTDYIGTTFQFATGYMSQVFSFLNDFIIIIGTVPIMLYYMLKDDDRVNPLLANMLPVKYQKEGTETLHEMDGALKGFIAGRMLGALFLGVLSFIGFAIIGLPYALLLSVVGALFSFIPYFGALLGAIPSVIVAFTVSPSMALWTIVVVVAAQQIEGNLISPYIYGKTVSIHPLTTVILLLIAGDFGGILGLILAIPVYLIAKILIVQLYKTFYISKKLEPELDEILPKS